ncbi:MAG TPA: hexitol phosphatase HxpB [Myxococcota bacterium]|nr:hexitol phosphatase HxpB [Myxococcota bacterium]HRY94193.1 hexitol phosphatase HxpB [Myxococcota bacterium]HSA23939.1 hexitol phosphatase HxpB [Myxococcota bacterium]
MGGRRIEAVLFDMDGVLIDSEPLWARAEVEVFGQVGLRLTLDEARDSMGLRTEEVVAFRFARTPWPGPSPAEVGQRLDARVQRLVRAEGRALPGAREAVAAVRARGLKLALASSSSHAMIDAVLARLGLERAFDHRQSADGEPLGKPHPAVFIAAAGALGVPASACLVVEDSLRGLVAAKAASMRCLVVPDETGRGDPRFALADARLPSLAAWDEGVWAELEAAVW